MNKKHLVNLALIGVAVYSLAGKKKEKYSSNELEKINRYSKYLEDKNFVVVDSKKYKKKNKKLKISNLVKYYPLAKKVVEVLL
ncbi:MULTISPECIES: hypothetical protein [unclassified Gemella]|uniref:hypothetical protein n=1 Tax=unclassified Gemella TaxID=2624949 RepID=UPI001C0481BC|nr:MULTISPECIES: hypothetical protein [unclassified Gemella]MBU0278052.1 hypothetical protein [Gemella sp. zg-1178]QWQ38419.1 hypothetical protein KMP11_05540 [Gemella sp. zg-570]